MEILSVIPLVLMVNSSQLLFCSSASPVTQLVLLAKEQRRTAPTPTVLSTSSSSTTPVSPPVQTSTTQIPHKEDVSSVKMVALFASLPVWIPALPATPSQVASTTSKSATLPVDQIAIQVNMPTTTLSNALPATLSVPLAPASLNARVVRV